LTLIVSFLSSLFDTYPCTTYVQIQSYTYYNYVKYSSLSVKHVPLIGVMIALNFVGLLISLLAVGYFLRHGQTVLKSTIFFSMSMCLGVGVFGLFIGEFIMLIAGLVAFSIVCIYANMVWKRIPVSRLELSITLMLIMYLLSHQPSSSIAIQLFQRFSSLC